ncbi:MAG: M4 family metallopeptidase [Bacteroidetes bacterium]|nr:M4 family metallopeptidase [Bacteroidota bacterium]
MKKYTPFLFFILALVLSNPSFSQNSKSENIESIQIGKSNCFPSYIKLRDDAKINFSDWKIWLKSYLGFSENIDFIAQNIEKDNLGNSHHRFIQTINGIPIYDAVYIVHENNNQVYSFNGKLLKGIKTNFKSQISSEDALQNALKYTNANVYQWQDPQEELNLKNLTGNKNASFYPIPELVLVPKDGNFQSQNYQLAYKLDVYAKKPMSRKYVFVDAVNGAILFALNRIQSENEAVKNNSTGTATTRYSGTQTIITDDSIPGFYRLRETSRGNGIETYNLNQTTDILNATDFLDSDNNWNNINPQFDEVATDAHWASEMTYDFYFNNFGRNSIDDNGFKLISYVHYDTSYVNAFWNGLSMTYGDGDGVTYFPLTTVDICGHEISHGLTEKTAGLIYANESGALNEGFSDIFGTTIEFFAKPSTANWQIGENMGPPFRDLSDPIPYNCPNTYLGPNWDSMFQEVHTNSGVFNYWYYLVTSGGSGVNGIGDSYNVSGIGMSKASAISYRLLTAYLTPSSDYQEARNYSIIAAIDLYGGCSPEVIAVTQAWYAVGVGMPYSSTITSDFVSGQNQFCSAPAMVNFTNNSTNSNSFLWNFGDGTTSTVVNPTHTYNSYGTFNVKLLALATGNCIGNDSITKIDFVNIDSALICVAIMPDSGIGATQTSCAGTLYDNGGTSNYTDNTYSVITIAPHDSIGVTLTFLSFSFELNWDYLKIYDGPNVSSPIIGIYTGNNLPNGGIISSTGNSITIEQITDVYLNESGFELSWQCGFVGVENISSKNEELKIIPNPSNGIFQIVIESGSKKMNIDVIDILGNSVYKSMISPFNSKKNIDLSFLAKGVYFIKASSEEKNLTKKLVIE